MKRFCTPVWAVLLIIGLLSACQQGDIATSEAERLEGIFGESAVFDDEAGAYLIGKDMYLDKASAEQLTADEFDAQQRYYGQTVGSSYRYDITYYLDPSVPNKWKWAHEEAVELFNALDIGLRFRRVWTCEEVFRDVPQGCDIYVKASYDSEDNWIGRAGLPRREKTDVVTSRTQYVAGADIEYNTRYTDRSWRRVHVALHELGHTVGLAHDFDKDERVVPGTPTRDNRSIVSYTSYDSYFSPNDI